MKKVYVIDEDNKPLMPTHPARARKLLKNGKAKVIETKPFTIKLNHKSKGYTQNMTLGVDSGSNNIGFSIITNNEEIISGEIQLLQGMCKRLDDKRMYRRLRRNRLRYRKPRFNNRKKNDGWLAPSIKHKLDSHIKMIDYLNSILPINQINVEVGNFDIQKINNPDIKNEEYQQGDMLGFYNTREYVLYRDNHKCQNPDCKNKSKQPILEVHHIRYKSHGGTNKPTNLITLCNKCHTSKNHQKGYFLYEWMINNKKVKNFKGASFMNTVKWEIINQLKEKYNNVNFTFGYITKKKRIDLRLEKSHVNDAFVIANGTNQKRIENFNIKQIRRNNRSLEKFYDAKYLDKRDNIDNNLPLKELKKQAKSGKELSSEDKKYRGLKVSKGRRSIRKQRYFYQPNDLVKYNNKIYTVRTTHTYGRYVRLNNYEDVKINLVNSYKFQQGFIFK